MGQVTYESIEMIIIVMDRVNEPFRNTSVFLHRPLSKFLRISTFPVPEIDPWGTNIKAREFATGKPHDY